MRKNTLLTLLFSVAITSIAIPQPVHAVAWCDSDWSNRKEITIANTNVDSDLTDFPLLISFTDTDVSAKANSDALDIFFVETANCTKLKWEKELYTSGTGVLVAWVKVPTVDADANTILYMYYGNSGAADQTDATNTWDTNFKGVWHLSETPGGAADILDSTSNINHGTSTNMEAGDQTAGNSDGSLNFDATDERVEVASNASLEGFSEFTLSAWINPKDDPGSSWGRIVHKKQSTNSDDYALAYKGTDEGGCTTQGANQYYITFRVNTDTGITTMCSDSQASPNTGWHHVAAVWESDGSMTVYLNGVSDGTDSQTGTLDDSNDTLNIGKHGGEAGRDFDGLIDETRVSNSVRSAAWIKFSYHSQKITAGTLTFGDQETVASSGGRTGGSPSLTITSVGLASTTSTSTVVSWTTSLPTDTRINWSTSLSGLLSQSSFQEYTFKTTHEVLLDNLTPDTTYYYVIHASSPGKGTQAQGSLSFTTLLRIEDTQQTSEDTQIPTEGSSQDKNLLLEQLEELQIQLISLLKEYVHLLQQKFLLLS